MDPSEQEQLLLHHAMTGDSVAIMVLLAQLHPRLRSYLARWIPSDLQSLLDPEDVLQETHLVICQQIHKFVPREADSLYRWAATIALRKLRNSIKASRTRKRGGWRLQSANASASVEESVVCLLELMGDNETPSRTVARHEAALAMEAALICLPENYQQAVRLVYFEGRSAAEAGAILGRTPRAVHNLCHKAKEQLREALGSRSRFLTRS
ncbi:MAG: sigma-70 family RNA polymerase sigma factor [Planctomycetes bacterium]|nr:sigma-70 family RNA polymerase sigma factor [Planctomycetota bacterium]MBI3834911.1 sigma-70 family RNA polymerase sigma factor [Planctomycetota bacterium]